MKYVVAAALIACALLAQAYALYAAPSPALPEAQATSTIRDFEDAKALLPEDHPLEHSLSFASAEPVGYSSCTPIESREQELVSKDGEPFSALQFDNVQFEGGDEFFLGSLSASEGRDPTIEEVREALASMQRAKGDSCADATRSLAHELSASGIAYYTALSDVGEEEMHAFIAVRINGALVPIEPQDKDPLSASRALERGDAAYARARVFQYPRAFDCS